MVATVFCVGVIGMVTTTSDASTHKLTYPGMYHSGIGGGGFALVRRQNGTYDFIDFREVAPAAAFEEMFVNDIESSVHGGNAR
jgi:gamma-glutamyltranspeptidase/glutathione hydrolase